jgi:hypothetical protein
MNRSGKQYSFLPQDFGLVRLSLPEGKVLDRVPVEATPIGEPCWVPGMAQRILFPAGDGQIYRYDFSEPGSPLGEGRQPSQPQRVEWGIAQPGAGMAYVRDLTWPTGDALGGRLIASLCYLDDRNKKPILTGPELWWLRLSPDQTVIEAAGRLSDPDAQDGSAGADHYIEERLANVATTADRDLSLVYLRRPSRQTEWDLHAAAIAIEPATGVPGFRRGSSRRVGRGFVASGPTFSADGRWIYGVRDHEPGSVPLALRRFPVTPTLLAQPEVIPIPASPARTHAEAGPLFGWADLVPSISNRLVEVARWRHAGD